MTQRDRDIIIAFWNLRRRWSWAEIRAELRDLIEEGLWSSM